jgi:hypothetical protein
MQLFHSKPIIPTSWYEVKARSPFFRGSKGVRFIFQTKKMNLTPFAPFCSSFAPLNLTPFAPSFASFASFALLLLFLLFPPGRPFSSVPDPAV